MITILLILLAGACLSTGATLLYAAYRTEKFGREMRALIASWKKVNDANN